VCAYWHLANRSISALNPIQFAHWPLRWLYCLLGWSGCVMNATGAPRLAAPWCEQCWAIAPLAVPAPVLNWITTGDGVGA